LSEAAKRELTIQFKVSDMTNLEAYPSGHFDVLGAFDNALPHLSVGQVTEAANSFCVYSAVKGVFVASVRDYDELVQTRPEFQWPSFFDTHDSRRIVDQVWDWVSADSYEAHLYISLQREGMGSLRFSSRYRCLFSRAYRSTEFGALYGCEMADVTASDAFHLKPFVAWILSSVAILKSIHQFLKAMNI
jgi:glycine/sarcosine N-methyltransferase